MKIADEVKNNKKGTDPVETIVNDEIHTIRRKQRILSALKMSKQKEWEKENSANFDILYNKQKKAVEKYNFEKNKYDLEKEETAKKMGLKSVSELKKYPAFTYEPESNFIGERIEFCLEQNNQEIAEFSRNVDISRSSMHRYINGTHLPSKKNLLKIIDGLFITPTDFSYLPDDFEEWKKLFDPEQDGEDIFAVSDYILRTLKTNKFTYVYNGKTMRLPNRYFTLFRKLVTDAVDILELLPHDKD